MTKITLTLAIFAALAILSSYIEPGKQHTVIKIYEVPNNLLKFSMPWISIIKCLSSLLLVHGTGTVASSGAGALSLDEAMLMKDDDVANIMDLYKRSRIAKVQSQNGAAKAKANAQEKQDSNVAWKEK